jgi:hypothetical protein
MNHKAEKLHQALLLLLMAAFTIVVFRSNGTPDIRTWLGWALHTSEIGIIEGYAAHPNYYPPLTITLLGFCQRIAEGLSIAPVYVIKFSLLLFLAGSTAIIYFFSNKNFLLTVLAYAALLLNSLGLAYLDLYFVLPLLYAIYCLHRGRLTLFAVFFSIACLTKYQPVLAAPFFAIYLLSIMLEKNQLVASLKKISLRIILPAIIPWLLAFIVFGKTIIISLISLTGGAWLSAQALNMNWIVTRYLLQSGIENQFPPWSEASVAMIRAIPEIPGLWADRTALFFYSLALLMLALQKKNLENLLLFSVMGTFSWFMLHTGAHENHLMLCSVLAIALCCVNRSYFYLTLGILLMSSLNMFMFYGLSGTGAGIRLHVDMNSEAYSYWHDPYIFIALMNVVYFLILWGATLCSVFPFLRHRSPK